jgi:hypothetical protein
MSDGQVGGRQRNAELHGPAVGHGHLPAALSGTMNREDLEAPTEQRMGRISHLDLTRIGLTRVLNRSINLLV